MKPCKSNIRYAKHPLSISGFIKARYLNLSFISMKVGEAMNFNGIVYERGEPENPKGTVIVYARCNDGKKKIYTAIYASHSEQEAVKLLGKDRKDGIGTMDICSITIFGGAEFLKDKKKICHTNADRIYLGYYENPKHAVGMSELVLMEYFSKYILVAKK